MSRTPTLDEDAGKPIEFDPDFNGPLKRRSCTDIICLLLFLAFVGCWIGVAGYAYTHGDTSVLLVPKDSEGSRCGYDVHVLDKPYLVFFDLTKCFGPQVPFVGCDTPQVCVSQCPQDNFMWDRDLRLGYSFDPDKFICREGRKPRNEEDATKLVKDNVCARWYLKSTPVLRRCLYNVADRRLLNIGPQTIDEISVVQNSLKTSNTLLSLVVHNAIGLFTDNEGAHQVGHDIVDDFKSCWKEILVGLIISILVCIIYIFIMRWIAKVMVWLSILGTLALLSFGTYIAAFNYDYYKKNKYEHEDARNIFEKYVKTKEFWLTILIIVSIILGLLLFVLIFLRKRIVLAIALIKEGSKAVSAVTSALFFPIVPWLLQMGVIAFAISIALYLSTIGSPRYEVRHMGVCQCSSGDITYKDGTECTIDVFQKACSHCTEAACKFVSMNNPRIVTYLQVFNVFGFFWSVFFVSAMGQMILAATFAKWYWTFNKSKVPFFTLTEATYRTLRYHIGTLAFGSLIIAICRMIRVFLEYLDRKLKQYDNEFTKAIMCCLKCFFWCLEKFLKFINKNAYIMCAIHGKNFCSSAKDAFSLLLRNIIRVFVLDKVTDFLFFLSKILVTLGVASLVYSYLEFVSTKQLNYTVAPSIFVGVCTYLVTCMFFNVYTMAVDTLFLCFLEDCERNDGSSEKPYFMSKNLMKILGKRNKSS